MGLLIWVRVWLAMHLIFCNFFSVEVILFPTIELGDLSYGSEGN
jgi:hypothetical protein